MKQTYKNRLGEVMRLAWQFVKRNGFTMSEALKTAWLNIKLKVKMNSTIVKFYYQKVDRTLREAYGTLQESMLPVTKGSDRKPNDTLFTYFDTERQEYRSFKKANLIEIL